jgi:hypothetical protein
VEACMPDLENLKKQASSSTATIIPGQKSAYGK